MQHTFEVLEGNLTAQEVEYLDQLVQEFSAPDPKPGFEGTGLFTAETYHDEGATTERDPQGIIKKIIDILEEYFLDKYEMLGELKFNRVFGVTMHEGSELPGHKDEDANNDGIFDGKKRSHVCSVILNDDYEGGNLLFPDLEKSISPKAGDMVAFPGYYVKHGVSKITKGTRRVLLVFFYDEIG